VSELSEKKLLEALKRLTTAVDKLSGGKDGEKAPSPQATGTAAKSALGSAAVDFGTNIDTQQQLLKILREQLETEELKKIKLVERTRLISKQNAMEQSFAQRQNATKIQDLVFEQELVKAHRERLEAVDLRTEIQEKQLAMLHDQAAAVASQIKGYEDTNKALDGVTGQVDVVLSKLLLSTKAYENSFFGKLDKASGGSYKNFFKGLGHGLMQVGHSALKALHPLGLFSTAVNSIKDETMALMKAQNELMASFAKSTGQLGDYQQRILTTREENTEFYVTLEGSEKANRNLIKGFKHFTLMSESAKDELASYTAQMAIMGVESETTTDLMNTSFTSLNLTMAESKAMMGKLYKAAVLLGTGQEELMQEFKASMPVLAIFGDKADDVFLRLAGSAKAAGTSTGDLLGVMNQFDTFQGAAESVSKLNAILGGQYLNSLEMTKMIDPSDRLRALAVAMDRSNRSWATMSERQKQAAASAINITDMALANQILGTSVADLDAQVSAVDGLGALSPEEMAAAAEAMTNFSEKLNATFESFTVLVGPLLWLVGSLLSVFIAIVGVFKDDPFDILIIGLIGALAAGKAFNLMMAATSGLLGGKTAALATAAAAETAAAAATGATAGAEAAAAAARATSTGAVVADTAATVASTAASAADAVVTGVSTAANAAHAAATAADTAVTTVSSFARGRATAARWAEAAATWMQTIAEGANTGATSTNMIVRAASTVGKWAATAASYALSRASWVLSAAMAGLGIASSAAALKLALIAGAIYLLAKYILVPMFSPALYIGVGMLAVGIVALGAAAMGAGPGLQAGASGMLSLGIATSGTAVAFGGLAIAGAAVAAVIAVIGLSILLAGAGLAVFALSMGLIALFGFAGAGGLLAFSVGIIALDTALLIFAATSWITLPVMFGLAAAMAAGGAGAWLLSKGMGSIGDTVSSLRTDLSFLSGALADLNFENFLELDVLTSVVNEFQRLVDTVASLDTFKMMVIGWTMRDIGALGPENVEAITQVKGLVQATSAVTPDNAEAVSRMISSATRLANATAFSQAGVLEEIRNIIEATSKAPPASNSARPAQNTTTGATEVKLYMDRDGRKMFARGIIDDISRESDRKLSISKGPQVT
jgi:hypothetical protein